MAPIRVLVVDDSAVVRGIVAQTLAADPDIDVVGTAANGSIALTLVEQLSPDLVTMDMEMPVMDGIETVRRMRRRGDRCRIIMFTTIRVRDAKRTFAAIAAGANDFVTKPTSMIVGGQSGPGVAELLIPRIKALVPQAGAGPTPDIGVAAPDGFDPMGSAQSGSGEVVRLAPRRYAPGRQVRAVVIGASMGGSAALLEVLRSVTRLPVPVLVVQHLGPVFTLQMAQWLDHMCESTVLESKGGEELAPGHVYVAPGGHHLELLPTAQGVCTVLHEGPLVNSSRPSVDTLFGSAVRAYGGDLLAVVLTGMGSDGLAGSAAVTAAGGTVLVQDEASSLAWGMPGAVANGGFAHQVLSLDQMGAAIIAEVHGSTHGSASSPGGR